VDKNYVYYHLNYSPDNKNEKILRNMVILVIKFGYPVFIVLDKNGKMIHVQQSDVLEEGKGYSLEKVKEFFNQWTQINHKFKPGNFPGFYFIEIF
jgi:hypothetical protein